MRLLFVVDGRSPIALNWIRYFSERGNQVHIVSTFPSEPDLEFNSYHFLPVAFSSLKTKSTSNQKTNRRGKNVAVKTRIRQWLAPLTISKAAEQLHSIVNDIKPDIVHAMRIPYEGMVTAYADLDSPFIVSVWGNDFTLHAKATPFMAKATRFTISKVDALHADCHRDIRLAKVWGFDEFKPSIVLPGGGGIQLDLFHPSRAEERVESLRSSQNSNFFSVINPRGMRAYVHMESFIKAIPYVIRKYENTRFYLPALAENPQVINWIKKYDISEKVHLLPLLDRKEIAQLFRKMTVMVSPSSHDGTPNTLLEAMASGCFPIAGDLESVREWITPGVNGLLIDPRNPMAIADAIILAFENQALREKAEKINLALIKERAEYQKVMQTAAKFYERLLNS
jgi:glycosyltransferase involved in cell wall biosynthesis